MSLDPAAARTREESFAEVYRVQYRPMVFFARSTTQSVEAAEEIAQDAFVQLFQHWDKVRDPVPWLRRAVFSLSTTWVRRTVRARALPATQDPGVASPVDSDSKVDVWRALAGLPERQRAMVVLRYVHDLSDAQIADAVGCRVGTVKSNLSRARDTLHTELAL